MLKAQFRKFISWILAVVMCYHIIGYAILFCVTDLVHQSAMEEWINKKELAILKISNSVIKHHPETFIRLNDEEIFYNGNYYDVNEETSISDFTFFQVLKDIAENNWHQQLSEAQTNSDTNHADGKTLKSMSKIFSPEWFSVFQFQFIKQNSSQHFLVYCDINISSDSGEIFLPPPQV